MARSLSTAKLLSTPVADAISLSIHRRAIGYAAAKGGDQEASGGGGGGEKESTYQVVEKVEKKVVVSEESGPTNSSWGPDPVTGYYRPDDRAAVIDTAEQREVALNHHHMEEK